MPELWIMVVAFCHAIPNGGDMPDLACGAFSPSVLFEDEVFCDMAKVQMLGSVFLAARQQGGENLWNNIECKDIRPPVY